MTSRPQDIQAKLDRASFHLKSLFDAEQDLLLRANPRVELQVTTDGPCYAFRAERVPEIQLGVIVGDVAHSLRCALDYAVCRLARRGGAEADLTRLQFPFGKAGHPLTSHDRKHVRGLSSASIERIEAARTAGGAALDLLRDINNQDKHRLLVAHFFQTDQAGFTVDLAGATGTITGPALDSWKLYKPLDDGDILALGHDERFTPNFGFMLCFAIEGQHGTFRVSVLSEIAPKILEAIDVLLV
ncbi:hypothetical protein [Altererythrobacter sp. Root672]|uniref:hypothetical protein n=1 Tax=Altererythrobacter sp. Root672 TaxID=1736584 RepID=UPI0006FE1019|nr:hypothetical protein [Altererythrobacter sp. Root672]KRA80303.1 hypothetical protein ASD76_14060 [Altererythrobacter sp. Root672]